MAGKYCIKTVSSSALAILVVLLQIVFWQPANAEQPQRYIVVLKDFPGASSMAKELALVHGADHIYQHVFNGFSAPLPENAINALQNSPNIESIEPDFEVQANVDTIPSGVDRIDADVAVTNGFTGSGARVAIVDTGIDLDHPDLRDRIDLSLSQTFVSIGATTNNGDDDQGHGTHVAGTVAASANGFGVIGVAPGATLIALKVLNAQGSGSGSDIIAALDFVTGFNNAKTNYADMIHVANFSLGGNGSDTNSSFRRAFEATVASGCFVAVAAGNESDDSANHVPAAYDAVFTISAMNPTDDSFASFSNYGADVDITAPGVNILSTYLGGGFARASGTSMATPHVAGAAALYVAGNMGRLTKSTAVNAIRNALISSGETIALTGDPDGIKEALVDAEALLAGQQQPADPALSLTLARDKESYTENDTQAILTATPVDENGAAVSGLVQNDFIVNGAPIMSFSQVSPGVYRMVIDISTLSVDQDHIITVSVTDNRGLTDSTNVTIRRVSVQTAFVSSIEYVVNNRKVSVEVTISNTRSEAVPGAVVDATIRLDGAIFSRTQVTTDSRGVASVAIKGNKRGVYTTTVNNVQKDGVNYDAALNASDPSFTR